MKKIIIVGLLATIGLESKPCRNQDVIVGRGNVYNFAEIIHLENLIKQKKEKKENDKNYSLDNINYPYGLHLV